MIYHLPLAADVSGWSPLRGRYGGRAPGTRAGGMGISRDTWSQRAAGGGADYLRGRAAGARSPREQNGGCRVGVEKGYRGRTVRDLWGAGCIRGSRPQVIYSYGTIPMRVSSPDVSSIRRRAGPHAPAVGGGYATEP